MRLLIPTLALFLSGWVPFLVIAVVGDDAVKALGRNPSRAFKILFTMTFFFVFVEAITIIVMLLIYNLYR